jgi:ABC-type glycerol-3-phosphate transport system permease component
MTLKDFELIIVIIMFLVFIICSLCALSHYRTQTKVRNRRYTTNVITSQTRPLTVYHVPLVSIEEEPPSYDQVVGNY